MPFVMSLGQCSKKFLQNSYKTEQVSLAVKIINMAYLRYGVNISCFWRLCVVLCYLEFSVKIGVPVEGFPCSEVASELSA